jgi:hypothetical protein
MTADFYATVTPESIALAQAAADRERLDAYTQTNGLLLIDRQGRALPSARDMDAVTYHRFEQSVRESRAARAAAVVIMLVLGLTSVACTAGAADGHDNATASAVSAQPWVLWMKATAVTDRELQTEMFIHEAWPTWGQCDLAQRTKNMDEANKVIDAVENGDTLPKVSSYVSYLCLPATSIDPRNGGDR